MAHSCSGAELDVVANLAMGRRLWSASARVLAAASGPSWARHFAAAQEASRLPTLQHDRKRARLSTALGLGLRRLCNWCRLKHGSVCHGSPGPGVEGAQPRSQVGKGWQCNACLLWPCHQGQPTWRCICSSAQLPSLPPPPWAPLPTLCRDFRAPLCSRLCLLHRAQEARSLGPGWPVKASSAQCCALCAACAT